MPAPGRLRSTLAFGVAAFLALAALVPVPARAAKATPFGSELIVPGYPNITLANVYATLDLIGVIGSFSSLIWWWTNRQMLDNLPTLIAMTHERGLKSMIQVGPTFLGGADPPDGYVKSFSDPATRARYLADVELIARAKPEYLVLMTEANLTYKFAPEEWQAMRSLYSAAYARVKAISPSTQVGASWLYALWYAHYFIDGVDLPAQLAPADFHGFTSYPDWLVLEGHYPSIAAIPADFHGRARLAYPSKPILFTEIAWPSKLKSTPEQQAEFVRNMPRILSLAAPALVSWALLSDVTFFSRDLLSAEDIALLEGIGVDIDQLFGHFNALGLLEGDGRPKPALFETLNLQFAAPP